MNVSGHERVLMGRIDGMFFRAGLFFGLGFVPFVGAVLCLTGYGWPGLFVVVGGAALVLIAYVEYRIFLHRNPRKKVP
jgi:hypothetical protein